MSGFSEFARYDGVALARLVQRREVSPEELLEASIARVEARNPVVNAVVSRLYDEARAAIKAGLPAGPFTGVPYLLKDIGALYKGAITSSGSRLFADDRADHDSELTARLKRAGLVIFGKSNTPELASCPSTEPRLFGATRNPWNLAHSAGGSSGGAAAAVASGMLPIAHATDGAGSIRMPASCCGLFGLKPTRARNPVGPDEGESWGGASVAHAITRTVRDSAALLDATSGRTSAIPTGRRRLPGRSCKRSAYPPESYESPLRLFRGLAPRLIPSAARRRVPPPHCARASAIASKRHVPRSTGRRSGRPTGSSLARTSARRWRLAPRRLAARSALTTSKGSPGLAP
jgi:Asp-tRNA(Asn)/Glu-tRNA(Gln) amidotransferase A subunit family amidase